MDLGSEISLNFKASIKKKLKETGTYIDDELPEYIMVMIANKRNEYQMKDDLSLFLGDETENFVTWLFVMLQRLQNAAKVDTTNSEAKPNRNTESSLEKAGPLVEEIKAINDEDIKPEEIVNEAESRMDKDIDEAKQIANSEDGARNNKQEEGLAQDEKEIEKSEKNYEKNKEGKEYSKHRSKSHEKRIKRRHRSRSRSPTRKQEDSDDDERRQSRERKRSSRHRRRSSGSSKRTRTDSRGDQEETNETSQTIESQVSVQKVRPSLPASRQATGVLIKRAMQEANVSVKPRSSSGHENEAETKNVPLDISVEVKNDRRRMHLKREKKLEENVEVSSRLQEEADDDDSEAGGKRLKMADVEKNQDDGIEVEVPENEFLDEESTSKKGSDQRIVIAHKFGTERQGDRKSDNDEEGNIGTANDEREKGHETTEEKLHVNGVEEPEKPDSVQDEKSDRPKRERRKHRHRRDKSDHRDKRPSRTRFVVTLHGALDEAAKIEKRRHLRSRHERRLSGEDPLFIDMNPKAPMVILESAQQEIDKMARKLDIMQNLLPTSAVEQYNVSISSNNPTIPLLPQNVPSLPVMPPRVGLQGNVLPGQFNPSNIHASSFMQQQGLSGVASLPAPVIVMQNMSDTKLTSKPKIKQREIIVPLRGEKDDELSDADSVEQTEGETTNTVTERCRFWPKCTNSSCHYIHPTIPCRMFPSCNFKDKCIFLHPMCKFDNRCTKSACPYTHTQKQRHVKPKFPQNGTSLDVSIPLCHFYPNCSKSNCPFRHPPTKACRYGSACNRKECPFHHETRPATGDSLKWSINSKQSQKHISDRPFAVSQQEVTSIPVKVTTA